MFDHFEIGNYRKQNRLLIDIRTSYLRTFTFTSFYYLQGNYWEPMSNLDTL